MKKSGKYFCLGCSGELIARVNGNVMAPHFAHKTKVECNSETYLHNAAKYAFYSTYLNCLSNDQPYMIELSHSLICRKYEHILNSPCNVGFRKSSYDLTQFYQKIFIEKKDDKFIPDVLLKSGKTGKTIYIEIAVTHFVSEDKERSGNRIIEVPIKSEEDIETIISCKLDESTATFIGFSPKSYAVQNDCTCRTAEYIGFYVYKSGKAQVKKLNLEDLVSHRVKNDTIIASKLMLNDQSSDKYESLGNIFYQCVIDAAQDKIPIKNCFVCRYSGKNHDYICGLPVYCKFLKFACDSNKAAECQYYKMDVESKSMYGTKIQNM